MFAAYVNSTFRTRRKTVKVRSRCVADLGAKKKALASLQVLDFIEFNGGTCGGRTHDKRIKSPLLYQLS